MFVRGIMIVSYVLLTSMIQRCSYIDMDLLVTIISSHRTQKMI